jgi:DNA-directed RNA polymerase subunit RPC12/RpoP
MSDERWTEFICQDCGADVASLLHEGEPICGVCRFIRTVPDMPEHVKRLLRHQDEKGNPL